MIYFDVSITEASERNGDKSYKISVLITEKGANGDKSCKISALITKRGPNGDKSFEIQFQFVYSTCFLTYSIDF